MAEREKIKDGEIFTNGVLKVMMDVTFGWVILLKESAQAEEEGFTLDEIKENSPTIYDIVVRNAEDSAFPTEFRDYVREFNRRSDTSRGRTLH